MVSSDAVVLANAGTLGSRWWKVSYACATNSGCDRHTQAAQAAFLAAQHAHDELYATWNIANGKAIGALTLRLTPQLRHYQTANITAQQLWINLERAFGAPSMSAIFADFKVVMGSKLSGGNPVPEIERMAELFRRLALNNFLIADALQGLMLLAALPPKWDSIAQLFMQRTNLAQALTFPNVRAAITQEYDLRHEAQGSRPFLLSAAARTFPAAATAPTAAAATATRRQEEVLRWMPGEGEE